MGVVSGRLLGRARKVREETKPKMVPKIVGSAERLIIISQVYKKLYTE
jgi:hypothetical protein